MSPDFNGYGRVTARQVLRHELNQPTGYPVSISVDQRHKIVEVHGHVHNRHPGGFSQGAGPSGDLRTLALLKTSRGVARDSVLVEFGYLESDATFCSSRRRHQVRPPFQLCRRELRRGRSASAERDKPLQSSAPAESLTLSLTSYATSSLARRRLRGCSFTTIWTSLPSSTRNLTRRSSEKPVSLPRLRAETFG
jgi:hypothetical protein